MNNFIYFSENKRIKSTPDDFIFIITGRIESKNDLLAKISEGLQFPGYFGHNFDALYDCLCDLSWLRKNKITIYHDEIPKIKEIKCYLEILVDATLKWEDIKSKSLFIYFPEESKKTIEDIIRDKKHVENFLL